MSDLELALEAVTDALVWMGEGDYLHNDDLSSFTPETIRQWLDAFDLVARESFKAAAHLRRIERDRSAHQ